MKTKERLAFSAEIKAIDDSQGIFEGYASVFGNVDSYNDIVLSGAFVESIKKRMPALLWQHDTWKPIGKYTEIKEDSKGLYVKGKLSLGVQQGREAYELLKDDAISGLSIGFWTKAEEITPQGTRLLKEVELMEVSIVTFPANAAAQVIATRSQPENIREFEKFLREVGGYNQEQAKIIASKGYRDFEQVKRDVDSSDPEILTKLEDLNKLLKGI